VAELQRREVRGWQVLRLSTQTLVAEVLPGLGGTIWSLTRRTDGVELFWAAPWGLIARGAPPRPGTGQALAADASPGGWQTLFPNGGDSVSVHGVEWGFDGEVRTTFFDWEFTGSSLVMTGRLARSPFEISKIISLRDHELTLGETIRNVGGERVEAIWGSRVSFGGGLVGPDTVIDTAATIVRPDPEYSRMTSYDDLSPWPRGHGTDSMINLRTVPGPDAGQSRMAYLSDFSRPWLRVSRPSQALTVDLEWDGSSWPHVWYALEAGGAGGYPWYRKGYFLNLTPCTSWPAHGVREARRVSDTTVWFSPGTARTAYATLRVNQHP
jgi:hypothetical protein